MMTPTAQHAVSPAQVPGLPYRAGLGLKTEHFTEVLETRADIGFFEVHAENYMVAGGPFHHYLGLIRAQYPCHCTASACPSAAKPPWIASTWHAWPR